MSETCGNCRFIHSHEVTIGPDGQGGAQTYMERQCRRFPPQVIANHAHNPSSHFPMVDEDMWCGEWKADE